MYGIALSVIACLRGGTRVDVAWNLDPGLTPGFDPTDAVAITPGGGRLGGLLGEAIDSRLIEAASARPTDGRVIAVDVNPLEADALGVEPGTRIRILLAPADTLPEALWPHLLERDPVGLVAELDGDRVTATHLTDPERPGVTFEADRVVSRFAPTPTLVILGAGPMAEALAKAGTFVGWNVEATPSPEAAVGLAATLSPIDAIVVMGHDTEATGRTLQAALGSQAGYLGSIGPRALQDARADWLAYRGVTDLGRVRAPAGLDIGADGPEEIAISVVAEIIAIRSAG